MSGRVVEVAVRGLTAARAVLDDRVELDGEVSLFPRDIELRFADAYDKLLRATDRLDLARDLLAGRTRLPPGRDRRQPEQGHETADRS